VLLLPLLLLLLPVLAQLMVQLLHVLQILLCRILLTCDTPPCSSISGSSCSTAATTISSAVTDFCC
jgi:hypothetical protein